MTKSKKKYKYLLSIAFLIVISVLTVYSLLKEVDIDEMFSILFSVDIKYVLLGMLLIVFYFFCEGASLKVIINSLGHKSGMKDTYVYGCINSFYSLITPFGTGGQPFTIYYMMHDGIPGSKVSIATLLNLLEYKLVLLVYCFIIVIFRPSLVFSNGILVLLLFIFGAVVGFIMIAIIALSVINVKWVRSIGIGIYKLLSKVGIIKKENFDARIESFNKQVDEYRKGAIYIKDHPAIFFKAFFYNFLRQTSFFAISYMVYLSFGLDPAAWFDVIIAQALIYITVDSLPLPGGVGATEKLFLVVYSLTYTTSMITPAVLLTRLINYVFAILFGGTFSFIKQISVMRGNRLNAK